MDKIFDMDSDEPIKYPNVMSDFKSMKWLEAMNVEM